MSRYKKFAKLAIAAREKTGLPYRQFAKLIGAGARSIPEWEKGDKLASGATRRFLALIRDGIVTVDDLERIDSEMDRLA